MNKNHFTNISLSNQLILLCSRIKVNESERDNFEEIITSEGFSWEDILNNAFKNNILPFVYFHLKNFGLLDKSPDEVRGKFEKFYHFNTARNAWILVSLEKIAEAFNYRGIPFILIQGASLLADIYKNPSLRYLSDIDILIKENDSDGIENVLSPLGWKMSDYPGNKSWCLKNLNHLPLFYRPGEPVPLEVHFKLSCPEEIKNGGSEWLWGKTGKGKIRSTEVTIPSPENMILQLSMHIFKKSHINDLTILLRHCCDISAILERYREKGIDIDGLVLTASKEGLSDVLYHSMRVTHSVIKENLLERIIDKISPEVSPGVKDFSEFVSQCLSRADRSGKVLLGGWESFFIQKGALNKIIFFFKSLFPSLDLMEEYYGVPKLKKKIYIYYFLRPFLLAGKFTWKRVLMAYRIAKMRK